MLGCSIVAMLINPLFFIAVCVGHFIYTEEPIFILFYILSYVVVGSFVWYLFREKRWKKQALLVWLMSNLVLLSLVVCWIHNVGDGMTGLMILTSFIVGSFLSAIPVSYCCYRLGAETQRHGEETHV